MKTTTCALLAGFFALIAMAATADDQPTVVKLWPQGAPGAVGDQEVDQPTLTIYKPAADAQVPTAVVVCPGGGYQHLAVGHEGREPADWLNKHGITAFVLKYRLAPRYHHPAPLQDVQRAIRYVRSHAKDYGIDPHRIGVWGFSAGGHLASTAATHFDAGQSSSNGPIETVSSRPDFAILCYPVVSLQAGTTHGGSRKNLLGDHPSEELVALLSNEKQVTRETPPTFLFHTNEDGPVPAENSILFYLALRKAGVPAELHVFEKGRHGVGLAPKIPELSGWPDLLGRWLSVHGWTRK